MKKIIRFALNRVPRPALQRVAHLAMPVAGLLYAGRGAECPVCGGRYRKFLPYGYVEVRSGALCPSCLSLERHRLLWLYLCRETDLFTGGRRLLHIAPEHCFIKRLEKTLGADYVTADLESPLARVKCDIQALPFADGEFGAVVCNHVLEHIPDDRLAMRELFRVMAPGGWGVVMVPLDEGRQTTYEDASVNTPEGRLAAFGQPDHLRIYGRDYADRLRGAGFEVDAVDYIGRFAPEEIRKYALRREIVFVVRKPFVR